MFRPDGREVHKIDGRWQFQGREWSGGGSWWNVTDPRYAAELDAEEAAGEMTDTLAEQYTRQGLPLPEGKG